MSAAYGIGIEHGWVNLLQKKLNKNFSATVQWNVVNASVSGETTAGGLARLPNLLKKYQPDICILELGANNGLRGQSLSVMEEQLNNLINQCKKYGSILLLGIKLPPNYGKKYSDEFHNIYIRISDKNNIPYVPFILEGIATKEKLMQADGVHPNIYAQPLILDNIWPILSNLIDTH